MKTQSLKKNIFSFSIEWGWGIVFYKFFFVYLVKFTFFFHLFVRSVHIIIITWNNMSLNIMYVSLLTLVLVALMPDKNWGYRFFFSCFIIIIYKKITRDGHYILLRRYNCSHYWIVFGQYGNNLSISIRFKRWYKTLDYFRMIDGDFN